MIRRPDSRHDDGFTLIELIIVLGLIGFVLGAAYALSSAMVKGSQVSQAQSVFARDSGEPLRIVDKAIMQAVEVEGSYCTSQAIQLLLDKSMNAQFQRIRISATPDKYLRYEEWQLDSAKVIQSKRLDILFSERHVTNAERGIPLFTYYDSNHVPVTDYTLIGSDSRSIGLALSLTVGDSSTVTSQTIMLRNMQ